MLRVWTFLLSSRVQALQGLQDDPQELLLVLHAYLQLLRVNSYSRGCIMKLR